MGIGHCKFSELLFVLELGLMECSYVVYGQKPENPKSAEV